MTSVSVRVEVELEDVIADLDYLDREELFSELHDEFDCDKEAGISYFTIENVVDRLKFDSDNLLTVMEMSASELLEELLRRIGELDV